MILIAVKQKFPVRANEWFCSLMILLIALWMIWFPAIFLRTTLSGFADIAPPEVWGTVGVVISASRIFGLILNGHVPLVSAPIRSVGAMAGVALFSSQAYASFVSLSPEAPSLGVPIFCLLSLADFYNSGRAGVDVSKAFEERN